MKPNFDISIPSIPGKAIKFKIQDIKQASFGSRKQRFRDSKKGLTKKFIQSFNNFHQPKELLETQQQTQASQGNSRVSGTSNVSIKNKIRHMIPEEKKHLIFLYDKFKDYNQPILNENKFDKGYSFCKAKSENIEAIDQQLEEEENKWTKKFVTDNYYFTSTLIETPQIYPETYLNQGKTPNIKQNVTTKKQKPSAVFKNQTREKIWDKFYSNQVPGPGFYSRKSEYQLKKANERRSASQIQPPINRYNDYSKLKQIITEIVAEEKQEDEQIKRATESKTQKGQFMFIKDDRDRFGMQKYPISFKANVPGPGSYDIMYGIQQKAKKVALVQEQRKLLKQWFRN